MKEQVRFHPDISQGDKAFASDVYEIQLAFVNQIKIGWLLMLYLLLNLTRLIR